MHAPTGPGTLRSIIGRRNPHDWMTLPQAPGQAAAIQQAEAFPN